MAVTDPPEPEYRFEVRAGLPVVSWPILDAHPLRAVVTTREGGVSEGPYESLNLALHVGDDPSRVIENRRRAAATIDLTIDDLAFADQVHGSAALEITRADRGRGSTTVEDVAGAADALVTTEPGVGLVVMVADCVPIVLFDPPTGTLACVHAGWRGTVARVAQSAVEAMHTRGADPGNVLAALGPAISPRSYQVGDDVAAAARPAFGADTSRVLSPDGHGRWLFDLWEANRLILQDAGVAPGNIAVAGLPTGDRRFYSDRAERPCGRFALLAALDG